MNEDDFSEKLAIAQAAFRACRSRVTDLEKQLVEAEARTTASDEMRVNAAKEIDRLKKELALEQMNGDCIMMLRDKLHERFGPEVDTAFFDDVVQNALVLARREVEEKLMAEIAKIRELLKHVSGSDHGFWPSACSACESARQAIEVKA